MDPKIIPWYTYKRDEANFDVPTRLHGALT